MNQQWLTNCQARGACGVCVACVRACVGAVCVGMLCRAPYAKCRVLSLLHCVCLTALFAESGPHHATATCGRFSSRACLVGSCMHRLWQLCLTCSGVLLTCQACSNYPVSCNRDATVH